MGHNHVHMPHDRVPKLHRDDIREPPSDRSVKRCAFFLESVAHDLAAVLSDPGTIEKKLVVDDTVELEVFSTLRCSPV